MFMAAEAKKEHKHMLKTTITVSHEAAQSSYNYFSS
jgi:hypothetical protein